MRWHPWLIQWCLNFKKNFYHHIWLYTTSIRAYTGFYSDLDSYLEKEAELENLPECKRHIAIAFRWNETEGKPRLWQNWNRSNWIYCINNRLARFERECCEGNQTPSIATHMLVLMIRGIFFMVMFPYVHLPTSNLTGEKLFNIIWETIERFEHHGFKVLVASADTASVNKFSPKNCP